MAPDETAESSPNVHVAVLQLLAGTAGIAAALAYVMGWLYEKSYLAEWGLPISAFDYQPANLMTVSTKVLAFALVSPVTILIMILVNPYLDALDRAAGVGSLRHAGANLHSSNNFLTRTLRYWHFYSFAAVAIAISLLTLFGKNVWATSLIVTGSSLLCSRLYYSRTEGARPALVGVSLLLAIFVVFLIPGTVAKADAKHDMNHTGHLPLAEIRIRGEAASSKWRVIRVNSGNLWVVPDGDKGSLRVSELRSDEIAQIAYLPKKVSTPVHVPSTTHPASSPTS